MGGELQSISWGSGGDIRHVQGGTINLDLGWGWGGGDISHVQGGGGGGGCYKSCLGGRWG